MNIEGKKVIPTWNVKRIDKRTGREHDYSQFDPREPFVDTRTDSELLKDMQRECVDMQLKIDTLKKRIANNTRHSKRPEDWEYKPNKLRTTYFDERVFVDGRVPKIPRVVTVVWAHNRKTGVTRYGAVQWTQGYAGEIHDKYQQRLIATKRYNSIPVVVTMTPVPKSIYEVQCCLRWMIHEVGVDCQSHIYKKWSKRQKESVDRQGRMNLKTL